MEAPLDDESPAIRPGTQQPHPPGIRSPIGLAAGSRARSHTTNRDTTIPQIAEPGGNRARRHAGTDPDHSPTRLQIALAVPAGSRRARDQRSWLRAVADAIARQRWYACRARHTAEVARMLARSMDWQARTSRPGHERMAAAAGVSLRTARRVMRWLESEGLVGLVSPGSTPDFRPGVLHGLSGQAEGNLAAVYVLTIPRKRPRADRPSPEFVPLANSRRESAKAPRTREARTGKPKPRSARATRALPRVPHPAEAFTAWRNPETRSEGLAAAEVIRRGGRQLRRLSARHWRHLARRFTDAGWTPGDVLYALDHGPGGREHGYTATIRHVAGWARYRLGLWIDPQGVPLRSLSQRRAAGRARVLAEQSARRQERLQAAERRSGPSEVWRAARARDLRLRGPASRRAPPAEASGAA